jgi:pimeloyl-ACP methyl ester carboxylesterase
MTMDRRTFLAATAALAAIGLHPANAFAPAPFASERISVVTEGEGPDVVLVHGLSSSRDIWQGTVAAVPGYRYHLVQIAGFAGTPARGNGGDGPLIAPVADEIARYIAEARLDRPALIGHSMGGTIAMMVAARHPDFLSKVMVVDMLPFMGMLFGPPGTSAENLQPLAEQTRARMAARQGDELRAAIEGAIATMVKTEALRVDPVRHGLESDASVSARGMRDLIVTDLRPELKAIAAPMTVLYVRAPNLPLTDEQMDAIYALSFADAPRATLKHIRGSYHFIMLDQPALFADQVRTFLTR